MKNELEKDLDFLEDYINVALGIQTLEHYDKNYLSGDNCTQSKAIIEHLKLASITLEKMKNKYVP